MFSVLRKNVSHLFSPKYLYYTNATLGSTFLVGGYIAADNLRRCINKNNPNNITSSKLKMLSVLGAFFGTYQTFAYHHIDRIKYRRAVFVKLFLDQLILAPISVSLFLFANESCDSNWDWRAGYDYTKKSFFTVFLVDMMYWLPAQFINFRFVQPRFRYAYVACASIVWNIIFSLLHFELQNDHKMKKTA